MTIRQKVSTILQSAIGNAQGKNALPRFSIGEVAVYVPKEAGLGHYASSVALQYASAAKMEPRKFAQIIKAEIEQGHSDVVDRVDAAGPGFLNFFLADSYLQEQLRGILSSKDYGKSRLGKRRKVNLEFVSANPTGKLQVGNGRHAFYGDVLANVLTKAGYKVTKEYYVNNAKTSKQIQELGKTALGAGITYLTPDVKEKIAKLKKRLERVKDAGRAGYLLAQAIHKENKKFLEKKAGVHFDTWTEEEELYRGKFLNKTLSYLKGKGLVYEKEGAQWLKITASGEEDKVLVRSSGDYGYFLADIAYHRDKIKRRYKIIIDVFGADHQGHAKPLPAVMKMLGYNGTFLVFIVQLVRAKGGKKLSKREGNITAFEELVDEVGVDAARFFYLTRSLDAQMEFDIALAKQQSKKNPVYYVQYSHARAASILSRAKLKRKRVKVTKEQLGMLVGEGELKLLRKLIQFPQIVEDTAQDFQVHHMTTYALELAQEFNQFYRDFRVLADDEDIRAARLALTAATGIVLRNCLGLLGISAPKKM